MNIDRAIVNKPAGKILEAAMNDFSNKHSKTLIKIAEDLGLSTKQIRNYCNGLFPKFKRTKIQEIDKYFKINIESLVYGSENKSEHNIPRDTPRDEIGPKYRDMLWFGKVAPNEENYFPLIPHKARAGYSRNYENVDYIKENFEMYPMPPGISPRGADWRWFEVGGESMLPVLNDGDYLLCSMVPHADWTDIDEFKIYVIVWKNDVSVKRVVVNNNDYVLISENEDEEPQRRIHLSDVKEVWKVRRRITAQLPPTKRFKITV